MNTPDVSVKYVIKDNSEWGEFADSVCRSYGFEKKSCPLVYTLEGMLIGDGRDFIEHVRNRFNKTLTITKEAQKNRTNLNVADNEERMRKKKEGDTLGEKIENYLEKLKKKAVSQLIDDAFYEPTHDMGIPFYIRKTDMLRDQPIARKFKDDEEEQILMANRTVNIPDELQIR